MDLSQAVSMDCQLTSLRRKAEPIMLTFEDHIMKR